MPDKITQTTPKRHNKSDKVSPKRDNRKRHIPNSREAWAEILATADRYY